MPASFEDRKAKILAELSQPDTEYSDLSPKGSVDEGIRELISEINGSAAFVTTSSCAGRIAVYLEGAKGAKGGGRWLYTSHDPVDLAQYTSSGSIYKLLGVVSSDVSVPMGAMPARFVHFKFEPLILHILTSSLQAAQHVLSAALQAGFRESGIGGVLAAKDQSAAPMVAVRSSGLAFDCIVGFVESDSDSGEVKPMVSEAYIRTLINVANQRFIANVERKDRFAEALKKC